MKKAVMENKNESLNSKIREYKDLVYKIKNMFEMIEKLGFDVFYEKSLLQEIIRRTDNFKKESTSQMIITEDEMMREYLNAILKLQELELKLNDKYKSYNEIVKTCKLIGMKISSDNSFDEVKTYSLMIRDVLLKIKDLNLEYFIQNENQITNDIFEIIYNVIKLEYLIVGKSDIYQFIIDNPINLYFFNKCIKKELESIDLKDSECKKIADKVYTIESQGLDVSYFDKELIKLMLVYKNSDYQEKIKERINYLIDEISVQEEWMGSELVSITTLLTEKEMDGKRMPPYIKNALIRILSLVLGTSLFLGGGFTIFNLLRKSAISPVFNKDSRVYSELTDSWSTSSEEIYTYNREMPDEERLVLVYSPWYEDKEEREKVRSVRTYDLSDITLDSVYEYLEYDLYRAEFVSEAKYEYDSEDSDKYTSEFKEVIENKYIDLEKEEQTGGYIGAAIVFELLYLLISLIIYILTTRFETNNLSVDEAITDLQYDFRMIRDNISVKKRIDIEVKKKLKKILDMIYENHELKMEFERLFEENKFLLNDPDELMEKINKIEMEKVKGKVRTLSKKYGIK